MAGELCSCDWWMRMEMLEGEREEKESVLNWTFYPDSSSCFPEQVFWIARGLLYLSVSERACPMGIQAPSSQTCPTLSPSSLPWAVKPPNDRNAYEMESCDNRESILYFHDFEEGKNWRNNLETLEMGIGEWEQKTCHKKRHLSLKIYSPNLWREARFMFFLRQKWKKNHIFCFCKTKYF